MSKPSLAKSLSATDPTSLTDQAEGRTLGLLAATGVGVGAIVGGGILALAGVAFATTGPSAILAFALNGLIALLTAFTFAEMATAFPRNGGTYTFAKKVLSVEAAFMVGWVVWFASIVAAALYALGFGSFARIFLSEVLPGPVPGWLVGGGFDTALALLATVFYTWRLTRSTEGGGQWETLGKMVVFTLIICAGFWFLRGQSIPSITASYTPFFAAGTLGLLQAMGYTFIALQGFDLIAAVGGEVRSPARFLPRAIVGSLLIALIVYLPMLFIVTTLGGSGSSSIAEIAQKDPEALVALAVENYLGRAGFWLVIVAALLSMLSALQANLLASSRIALAMATDRNLSPRLGDIHPTRHTPVAAILASSGLVAAILLILPDVAVAGAVASLIFLLSFTLAHWTATLARRRGGGRSDALRLPFFPLVPILGGISCFGLAVFQGVAVPSAGAVAVIWLGVGAGLYFFSFSHRARVADAAAEALDPQLVRLRGRAPTVLVPIANPASAESLVRMASALTPPDVGKVLLLYVVRTPEVWEPGNPPEQLLFAQQVLGQALTASFASDLEPQALTTIAPEPWREIHRVARHYRCESVLLGLGALDKAGASAHLLELLREAKNDVVILRAPEGWHLQDVRRILVPVGGRRDQSSLRARLLGSLCRTYGIEVNYLGIVPESASKETAIRLERDINLQADDEAASHSSVDIVRSNDITATLLEFATKAELVILGLRRPGRDGTIFGEIPQRVARETGSAVLMIQQKT